uniref:Uncharacterized protein n=1 Tax=Anguilla anguilla TaxID=7936 RepID=A0A0E9PNM9_ANGAN
MQLRRKQVLEVDFKLLHLRSERSPYWCHQNVRMIT